MSLATPTPPPVAVEPMAIAPQRLAHSGPDGTSYDGGGCDSCEQYGMPSPKSGPEPIRHCADTAIGISKIPRTAKHTVEIFISLTRRLMTERVLIRFHHKLMRD